MVAQHINCPCMSLDGPLHLPSAVRYASLIIATSFSLFGMAPYLEVYERELHELGFGFPIWLPDPKDLRFEVQIGDVGYVSSVRLHFLFCFRYTYS